MKTIALYLKHRAGRKTLVHLPAGKFLAIFFVEGLLLKELSIFIDESGDFGEYSHHSPYYIITMIFHEQSVDISNDINHLNTELSYLGLNNHCIHTGPIIRKEDIYQNMSILERRQIFNKMMAFIRNIDIKYKSFYIEKKHIEDSVADVVADVDVTENYRTGSDDDIVPYGGVSLALAG